MEGYDIIGDVHGCATKLEALLVELGYQKAGGTGEYRHPDRQAVFVGDLIDRGDEQLQVLRIVKSMVDAGSAKIVMGNHEFNALAYDTEWPPGSGTFLRRNTEKNTNQHQAFLDQVTGEDRRRYLKWFTTIPMWLDLGGVRVIHACWHEDSMRLVEKKCGSSAPFREVNHLVAASDENDPLFQAIETLLKGPRSAWSSTTNPNTTTRTATRAPAPACSGGTAMPAPCATSLKWAVISPQRPVIPTHRCPS